MQLGIRPRIRPRSHAGYATDGAGMRCHCKIELDPEYAALAYRALHTNVAAHQFGQPFAYYQPDARAFFGQPLLSEAVERLKQVVQVIGRQPGAGVTD